MKTTFYKLLEIKKINLVLDEAETKLLKIESKLRNVFLRGFSKTPDVKEKSKGDFVTSSDKEIEKIFKNWVLKNFPKHFVYGEEDGGFSGDLVPEWLWAIDPIDGTNNYQFGNTDSSIVISLRYKGNPVLALSDFAAKNDYNGIRYFARLNKGFFRNKERVFASKVRELKYSPIVLTKLDFPERMMIMVSEIWDKGAAIHMNMASVYEGCLVASGEVGVGIFYETGPHEWPAMYLFAKESGCIVGSLNNPDVLGLDLTKMDSKNLIIAANKQLYNEAVKFVHLPPTKKEYVKLQAKRT